MSSPLSNATSRSAGHNSGANFCCRFRADAANATTSVQPQIATVLSKEKPPPPGLSRGSTSSVQTPTNKDMGGRDEPGHGAPLETDVGRERLGSMEARLDLFAEQLQRLHDPVMRDLGAAIHLAQDAVEAERLLQPQQPV